MARRYCVGWLMLLSAWLAGCEVVPYQPQPAPAPPPVAYPNQPPPPNYAHEEIRRCRADNRRAHQEVLGLYENARRAGRINPREAQRFNSIEGRLQNLKNDLARDGISLQDCQRIGGAIAWERDEVLRMSRYVSPLTQCVADNRRAHDDIYIVYNEARRAGRIDGREAQQFAAIDQRLRNYQAAVQRDGMTLNECQRVGQAIAQERAIVDRMAQY